MLNDFSFDAKTAAFKNQYQGFKGGLHSRLLSQEELFTKYMKLFSAFNQLKQWLCSKHLPKR
jgi:hypothetical protein